MCDTTGGVTSISLRSPDLSPISSQEDSHIHHHHHHQSQPHGLSSNSKSSSKHGENGNNNEGQSSGKQNQVGTVMLFGVPIVSLVMDGKERLCLAQISSTLLKDFSYNEIHNRRVALGITCVQCTPVQLEILRRAGAMPVTSRRCGMITRREAERLCQSFLGDHAPPQLPENFAFEVYHECGWGSRGSFVPSRYNSSRAKCIRCTYCQLFFSPNKFIFHSHRLPESRYVQPDAANFNSWRRHLRLCGDPPDDDISISSNTLSMDTAQIVHAWEDVRAMFNGGTRKRMLAAHSSPTSSSSPHHRHHYSSSHGHGHPTSRSEHSRHTPTPRRGSSKQHSSGGHNGSSSKSQTTPHQSSSSNRHQHEHPPTASSDHNNGPTNINNSLLCSSSGPLSSQHHTNNSSNPQTSSPLANPSSSSPNFLASNPLLSPSTRFDIWNPGLSPALGMGGGSSGNASGRLAAATLAGNSQLSHLPFHPLSIPWLRRPLFPFPHPFTPTAAACHLLAADAGLTVPEKLAAQVASLSGVDRGRSVGQSAFKPVSHHHHRSNAEHLFSWLNNNNSVGPNMLGGASLPEDLSTTSNHHHHNLINLNHASHLNPSLQNHIPLSNAGTGRERASSQERPSVSSTNDENGHSKNFSKRPTGHTHNSSSRHQVAIMSSAGKNDTDDEENVDIESTEVEEEEECSSTSFIWVNNNNNDNDRVNVNLSKRKKRLSVDSNNSGSSGSSNGSGTSSSSGSGEDEKFSGESENCSSPQKRKRLWDFDRMDNTKVKKAECCDETTRTSGFELPKD